MEPKFGEVVLAKKIFSQKPIFYAFSLYNWEKKKFYHHPRPLPMNYLIYFSFETLEFQKNQPKRNFQKKALYKKFFFVKNRLFIEKITRSKKFFFGFLKFFSWIKPQNQNQSENTLEGGRWRVRGSLPDHDHKYHLTPHPSLLLTSPRLSNVFSDWFWFWDFIHEKNFKKPKKNFWLGNFFQWKVCS